MLLLMKYKDWQDGSVSLENPTWDVQNFYVESDVCDCSARPQWPASLVESVSSGFGEGSHLKNKEGSNRGSPTVWGTHS